MWTTADSEHTLWWQHAGQQRVRQNRAGGKEDSSISGADDELGPGYVGDSLQGAAAAAHHPGCCLLCTREEMTGVLSPRRAPRPLANPQRMAGHEAPGTCGYRRRSSGRDRY